MKKKFIYTFACLALFVGAGCEKLSDFGDTNDNPGATTEPIIGALLTNSSVSVGGYASQTRGGLYSQYFSETQYTDVSLYQIPQLNFSGEYSGVLFDLQNIINLEQSNNMSTIAKILQQYIFWTVTDRWGDVPYSEALQGVTPKYDTQEEIYKGMIQTLSEAVNAFDGSAITGDIINGGDIAAWKQFANSLRMMMALQLSKRYPSAGDYAATQFTAALNDPAGYISDNADNVKLTYPGGNFPSAWWGLYNGRKDFAESKTMTDLMASLSDGRQAVFGGASEIASDPNATATSNIGVPYGLARADAEAFTAANPTWARVLRGDKRTQTGEVVVLSAAQVTLARAEAADYGWTSEDLTTLYRQGIEFSFEQWGLSAPASYFSQGSVNLSAAAGSGANLSKIATQRYIAHYPDGLQGWNIWRKTGYPALTPAPAATNEGGQIPRRYVYHTSEYSTNKAGVEPAVERLNGGDSQDSRIWWDQ